MVIFVIHHAWQQRLADVTLVCIMVAGVRHSQSTGRWWGRPTLKIVYLKAGQFKSSLVTTGLKKDCCREQNVDFKTAKWKNQKKTGRKEVCIPGRWPV